MQLAVSACASEGMQIQRDLPVSAIVKPRFSQESGAFHAEALPHLDGLRIVTPAECLEVLREHIDDPVAG